ncbi:LxmA leader domain family RiPP [Streptomyces sp. NPDC096040]|uniref:LxmA leader domain family RiPP n=1 Tax=Streptomyces sp. NPDC096040 TaxID=3155541 RepID=UPI00332AE67E
MADIAREVSGHPAETGTRPGSGLPRTHPNTADQLLAGYTAYTDAEEFGASASADAPATTLSILSFIGGSSGGCGAAFRSLPPSNGSRSCPTPADQQLSTVPTTTSPAPGSGTRRPPDATTGPPTYPPSTARGEKVHRLRRRTLAKDRG